MVRTRSTSSLLALVFAALAAEIAPAGDLDDVRARGALVMLCVPHQENAFIHTRIEAGPMRSLGSTEHFAGVDVSLMAGFAESLGVRLEIRPGRGPDGIPSYTQLVPALLRRDGDIIASSFSITPARAKLVDYSVPYITVRKVVVARSDRGITTAEDLEGKTAGAIAGSSQEEHLRQLGFDDEHIRHASFVLENYQAVADGKVDFIVVDSTSAMRLASQFDGLEVAFELPGEDPYGVAVRPDSDLLPLLDRYLAEARDSGRVDELIRGSEPKDVSP
jgi:polar amino acid transport system substrate-binding protein